MPELSCKTGTELSDAMPLENVTWKHEWTYTYLYSENNLYYTNSSLELHDL